MFRVVGCRGCDALWLVADRPETTRCPRCGSRYELTKLRPLVETSEEDAARRARARLLAARSDHDGALDDLDDVARESTPPDEPGVSDTEYLAGMGLDPDDVAAAGERATAGGLGGSSRRDAVIEALEVLDRPTAAEVADHVAGHGVSAETAEVILERLARAGRVSESGGRYRRV